MFIGPVLPALYSHLNARRCAFFGYKWQKKSMFPTEARKKQEFCNIFQSDTTLQNEIWPWICLEFFHHENVSTAKRNIFDIKLPSGSGHLPHKRPNLDSIRWPYKTWSNVVKLVCHKRLLTQSVYGFFWLHWLCHSNDIVWFPSIDLEHDIIRTL